ncbi:hypothetical protein GN956_G11967 [Arapaima gigas]
MNIKGLQRFFPKEIYLGEELLTQTADFCLWDKKECKTDLEWCEAGVLYQTADFPPGQKTCGAPSLCESSPSCCSDAAEPPASVKDVPPCQAAHQPGWSATERAPRLQSRTMPREECLNFREQV